MSLQELCGNLSKEITSNIMSQNGSNAFQKSDATNNAYSSAVASYDATLAANKGITNNIEEATEAAFTSSVTASSVASVTSTLILNTIVSNTSLLLLEKFNYSPDTQIVNTFNYYWDLYPDLFGRIQILYTDIDENGNPTSDNKIIIENNIKYLNEYYSKGYRVFVAFDRSSIIKGVLPWFETIGTEAKGISLTSTAGSLDIPKPIYRLQSNDNKSIDALNFILNDASKIYYIYSEGEVAGTSALIFLETLYPNKIISYPVKSDSSNLTLENIKILYKDVDNKSVSILLIFINTQQTDFVNLFNDSYPMPNSSYDILLNTLPKINETSKNALVNKYNFLSSVSFSTSELYRDGLKDLETNFSPYVPNALLLINKLAVNANITTLPGHNSVLEFNENNDIKYFTFLNSIYSKDDKGEYYYKDEFYSVYDPIIGKQTFYVNN
jgi:hypothetical protein